jgi:hypothetical protein
MGFIQLVHSDYTTVHKAYVGVERRYSNCMRLCVCVCSKENVSENDIVPE